MKWSGDFCRYHTFEINHTYLFLLLRWLLQRTWSFTKQLRLWIRLCPGIIILRVLAVGIVNDNVRHIKQTGQNVTVQP